MRRSARAFIVVCALSACDGHSRQAAGCGRDFGEGRGRRMERRRDRGGQPLKSIGRTPTPPLLRYGVCP